jgi:hypothetical protein
MNNRNLRKQLERVEIPEEHDTRERAWALVQAAFAEREPVPQRRPLRPLVAVALVGAAVAAALSPPGRAVIDEVREAIGIERVTPSRPALVSLPASGRLLVNSPRGGWIVQRDGSKRFLGRYRQASWSPRGLFVVATGAGKRGTRELVALDPKGNVRWSIARSGHIRSPRWAPSGFRIAYKLADTVRVIAGDGTGDRWLAKGVGPAAPAWRPGQAHVLAVAHVDGRIRIWGTDTRALHGISAPGDEPRQLAWSRDGRRLLAVASRSFRILDLRGRLLARVDLPRGAEAVQAAFAPSSHSFALLRRVGGRSDVVLMTARGARRIFAGLGRFTGLEWSPDGRWLAVAWETADQWLFIRSAGVRKIVAVSGIARQFDPGVEREPRFPSLAGWCCPPLG